MTGGIIEIESGGKTIKLDAMAVAIVIFFALLLVAIAKRPTDPVAVSSPMPRWLERLAIKVTGTDAAESTLGNLDELFERDVSRFGVISARLSYCKNVLSMVYSFALSRAIGLVTRRRA
jgi:hypothetical protein